MTGWWVDSAERDGRLLGEAARAGRDAVVRSCPDWTGADLLAHAAGFARYVDRLLGGAAGPTDPLVPVAPDEALRTWDDDLARLVDRLRSTPPDAPVPNWSVLPDEAAFWARRAAHELAVHRWDAGTTSAGKTGAATPDPLPAPLARDGIAEYFEAFAATAFAAGAPGRAATIVLEPVDGGEPLQFGLPDPGPVTLLRGTASDLLLALWWRRDPLDHLVSGDRALLAEWPRI